MDFALDKKYEMAQNLFREFAQNEVKPLAQEIDEQHRFPRETVEKMAKYGFLGIPVSKELGGQGCDILTYAMCVEELSKVCGTTGVIVSAHTSLCVDPIVTFGTPAQKEKYVPDLASGRKLGAFGLTEPGAGTDAQGQQTKAVLDGDEWVLLSIHRREGYTWIYIRYKGEQDGYLWFFNIRAYLHRLPYSKGRSSWTEG